MVGRRTGPARTVAVADRKSKVHAAPLTESAQEFSDKVFATFGDKRTTRLFANLDALAEVMEKTISENKK